MYWSRSDKPYLEFRHQRLHQMQELSCCLVCHILLIKAPLQCREQFVKFPRLDNWPVMQALSSCLMRGEYKILPGDDVELAAMQTRNEIGILLFFDYLLKLEREPETSLRHNIGKAYLKMLTLVQFLLCPSRRRL